MRPRRFRRAGRSWPRRPSSSPQRDTGATTVEAVAEAAGVSRKTVFTAVGGKLDLLKTALDWAVAGDDRPVALADRGAMRGLLERNGSAALITGWVHMLVEHR